MWAAELPAADDVLRQGDLLCNLPFPKRGTLELSVAEMRAAVYPSRMAVVLDQCCTVEQKYTVLLGRVGEVRRLPADHALAQALAAQTYEVGQPYSKYMHLLDPIDDLLPDKSNKVWVIELTERVSIGTKTVEDLGWLQGHRQRRMTAQARARLRARLTFHFAEAANDDRLELAELGLDLAGNPLPQS